MLNKILFGIVVAVVVAAVIYIPKAIRVYNVVHLFDEDKIVKNFMHMNKVFPSTPIKSSDTPHIFETGAFELPEFYEMNGEQHDLLDALDYFKSDGLIVLHEGNLVGEYQNKSKNIPEIISSFSGNTYKQDSPNYGT